MKIIVNGVFTFLLVSSSGGALAYKPNTTHSDLTGVAVSKSALLTDPALLPNLGLLPFSQNQLFSSKTITNLFQIGVVEEDDGTRGLNHFYDPYKNRALTVFGFVSPGKKSPDWALEDTGDIAEQLFSYKDARDFFYRALTTNNPAFSSDVNEIIRKGYWSSVFGNLGHTIHHIQDMAQPQHVRNDQHCDLGFLGCFGIFDNLSRYEVYSGNESRKRIDALASSPQTIAAFPDSPVFKTPRDFWKNAAGTGIAEFTNQNFVSQGTNFTSFLGVVGTSKYPFPLPGTPTNYKIDDLYAAQGATVPTGIQSLCTGVGVNCRMTMYPTQLTAKASTLSIFDQDLQAKGVRVIYDDGDTPIYYSDRLFALNRFNFDAAHETLIPKAVSYSAGLINYFFRGKMEISLPDEGIYGIVDHAVEYQKDTSGFRKIKLKLRNVTPSGSGIEPMASTGKLVAVVKFHRNTCYQPNLSGEYGAPGIDKNLCRSKDEEVVVSTEIDAPGGINLAAQPLSFNFLTPIPINATDVYLQVVYRGPLGEETDAVVVATKDIAEPNFFGQYDTTEQFLYGITTNLKPFKELFCDSATPPIPYEECKFIYRKSNIVRFTPPANYDAANPEISFGATLVFSEIPVSRFARVAFLSDTSDQAIYNLRKSYGTGAPVVDPTVYNYSLKPWVNQVNNNVFNSVELFLSRGVYANDFYRGLLGIGDATNPPNLNPVLPVPSQINF